MPYEFYHRGNHEILGECFCDVTEWPQARWFKYMFWQIQLTNSTLTLASLCKLPFNKDGIFITRKNTELLSLKFVSVVKKYAWADFLWLSHFAVNIFFLRSWLTITEFQPSWYDFQAFSGISFKFNARRWNLDASMFIQVWALEYSLIFWAT